MKEIKYLRDYLADLYLDWVNNFLTIEVFAEYYGLDDDDARDLLKLAKKCHEQRVDYLKDIEEMNK
jgi:hypothetical protein